MSYQEYKVKVYDNGDKFWCQDGKLHRLDGPAFEGSDGTKFWYKEGKLHRLDGPAREYINGPKEWYKEGKFHREDGPAIEYANGDQYWCIEGKEYTEEEFLKKTSEKDSCDGKIIKIDGKEFKLTSV